MQVPERKGKKKVSSNIQDEYNKIKIIQLQYEKEQINQDMDSLVNNFDEEI